MDGHESNAIDAENIGEASPAGTERRMDALRHYFGIQKKKQVAPRGCMSCGGKSERL
jgi:hypothetical protein